MSNKNILGFLFICLFFLIIQSCNWHTLKLHPVSQPIYLGPQITSSEVDTVGIISGLCVHEKGEETVSQTRNVTISIGGKDYTKENINSAISTALQNDPNRFIANGQMVIDIEHGISAGAILSSIVATIITSEDSDMGFYTNESIYFRGTVYRLKTQEDQK